MAELADLFRAVAQGAPPPADDDVTVVVPPDERSVGVLGFTGHNVISADVTVDWVRSCLPPGRVDAPLSPPFLAVLAAITGRVADNIDVTLVAPANGRRRGAELTELTGAELTGAGRAEPDLVRRAWLRRTEVRAFTCEGGLLVLGRGVAGRWEAAVEVDPVVRGFGLGRALFAAALGLLPAGEHLWAQIAPANAASLRSAMAAGYRPVGAEALLLPVQSGSAVEWDGEDGEAVDWFRPQVPADPLPDPDALPDPDVLPEPGPLAVSGDLGAPGDEGPAAPRHDGIVDTELSVPAQFSDVPSDRADFT